jgi:Lrp/AsnC family transcriptional regulator for asnA, asnC and gidA
MVKIIAEIDELDRKILGLLQENGRLTFTEIAQKLRLSESTIRKRVQALQERGVIKKFNVEIDPAKIGLNTVAIVGIDVDPPKLLEVAQKLCELKEIRCVATSTGDHMIMTEIWTKDGRELTRLISEKIGPIEGVKKICPAIILEKLKG